MMCRCKHRERCFSSFFNSGTSLQRQETHAFQKLPLPVKTARRSTKLQHLGESHQTHHQVGVTPPKLSIIYKLSVMSSARSTSPMSSLFFQPGQHGPEVCLHVSRQVFEIAWPPWCHHMAHGDSVHDITQPHGMCCFRGHANIANPLTQSRLGQAARAWGHIEDATNIEIQ